MNNFKRSKLGEISGSEAQILTQQTPVRVLPKTRRNLRPFRWRGLAARSFCTGTGKTFARATARDPFNPLTITPPSLFNTTHLHNPPTTLTPHPSPSPSSTTTSPLEQHLQERNNFKRSGILILVTLWTLHISQPRHPPLYSSSHLRTAIINAQSFVHYTQK